MLPTADGAPIRNNENSWPPARIEWLSSFPSQSGADAPRAPQSPGAEADDGAESELDQGHGQVALSAVCAIGCRVADGEHVIALQWRAVVVCEEARRNGGLCSYRASRQLERRLGPRPDLDSAGYA